MEADVQEVGFLASRVKQMDPRSLSQYEGVLSCIETERRGHECSIKDLINASYNLEYFEFMPGIVKDADLGENAVDGDFLRILEDVPDEVIGLLDLSKVGKYLRRSEKGPLPEMGTVSVPERAGRRSMTARSCRGRSWKRKQSCLFVLRTGIIRKTVRHGFPCL